MSTNKITTPATKFVKGSSDTLGLQAIYGTQTQGFDPKKLLYTWNEKDGTEASGLREGVIGNDDFLTGFDINFGDAPKIPYFAPDIQAPGDGETEHPDAGTFGEGNAADLSSIDANVQIEIDANSSAGKNGDIPDPVGTSTKIGKQTVGSLIKGQSYENSGN